MLQCDECGDCCTSSRSSLERNVKTSKKKTNCSPVVWPLARPWTTRLLGQCLLEGPSLFWSCWKALLYCQVLSHLYILCSTSWIISQLRTLSTVPGLPAKATNRECVLISSFHFLCGACNYNKNVFLTKYLLINAIVPNIACLRVFRNQTTTWSGLI